MKESTESGEMIQLNELPKWSKWPERLLGLTAWSTEKRTLQKVEREFNVETYGKCLDFLVHSKFKITADELRYFHLQSGLGDEVCISRGEKLKIMSLAAAIEIDSSIFLATFKQYLQDSRTIIELGSGYGYYLNKLNSLNSQNEYLGWEYSTNAIKIGEHLYKENINIKLSPFNFYDEEYKGFETLKNGTIIFSCFGLHGLPTVAPVIEKLSKHKSKIERIISFEPVVNLGDLSLLGMLRKRYTLINEYNQDLLAVLNSRDDVQIHQIQYDVFGLNSLHPHSIIEWSFNKGG